MQAVRDTGIAAVSDNLTALFATKSCNFLQKYQEHSQYFPKISTVIHEKYSHRDGYDSDIALIKLRTPLTFNDYVQPVCLPSTPIPVGTNCVVTGWGDTKGKSSLQNLLLFTNPFFRQ